MSAVASILKKRGFKITGSDVSEKFFTDEVLKKEKISYYEEFDSEYITDDIDLVIYSTAYNEKNNPEFKKAKEIGLKMMSYPEILGILFKEKFGIAVCGTHGKTTTSALAAYVLEECGLDPSAVIGSKVINWGSNSLSGKGKHMVIEADEWQNKLAMYDAKGVILTSIDFDHPDFFKDFKDYKKVFQDFVAKIGKEGFLVFCQDDKDVVEVSKYAQCRELSYGFSKISDFVIKNFKLNKNFDYTLQKANQSFEVYYKNKSLGSFRLKLIGKHNALNATSVIALSHLLRVDLEKARKALEDFKGTARRFEYYGKRNGALLFDDYGHLPKEIKVVLKTARNFYPKRDIISVFQPHSFSRTESLLPEFAGSFDDADEVVVLDIYGSARETSGNVHSKDLVDSINKDNSNKAKYIPTIPEVVDYLKDRIGKDDVVIAIGAGSGWEVVEELSKG